MAALPTYMVFPPTRLAYKLAVMTFDVERAVEFMKVFEPAVPTAMVVMFAETFAPMKTPLALSVAVP